jgi:uncharacterized protein YjiS (DUF1127 family)
MRDDDVGRGWLPGLLSRFKRSRRRRAVDDLSALNSRLLRDIGIVEDDVEAAKWFWCGGWGEITSIRNRRDRRKAAALSHEVQPLGWPKAASFFPDCADEANARKAVMSSLQGISLCLISKRLRFGSFGSTRSCSGLTHA